MALQMRRYEGIHRPRFRHQTVKRLVPNTKREGALFVLSKSHAAVR